MESTNTHYTVLARRFRPQTFGEVVGQQHVARALQNAIRHGRVAHAYLFTGARGVGKTSTARILAKALNCPNADDAVPCNECDTCRAIAAGHDVDVLEIDGASNRGIDDIRQLRANVNVKPMRSRYKIYIIDEVHMLTTDAFNALLKTLEEPPSNVKFVFCTTEPDKLLDTILSRCQRFDFASIETENIAQRLGEIAAAEGFTIADDALELVARRAGGSMRDSQSLLDQVLAFAEDTVTAADVHRLLGTATDDRLVDLAESLINRDRAATLRLLDEALGAGVQLTELTDQMLRYLRDLMLVVAGAADVPLLSVAESLRPRLLEQGNRWGLPTVVAALQILSEARSQMARVSYGRVLAELALVRIGLLEDLRSLDELVTALSQSGGRISVPTANGGPKSSATVEKKKLDAEPAPPPIAESPPAEKRPQPPRVELAAGRESEFMSQIVSEADVKFQGHLKSAALAIFGPNDLELRFPQSYDFSRRFCERPENLSQLERMASRLAGCSVRITVKGVEPEGPAPRSVVEEPTRQLPIPDAEQVPFVNRVATVFGAKVVSVQSIQRFDRPQDES